MKIVNHPKTFMGEPMPSELEVLAEAAGGYLYTRASTLWLSPWDLQLTYSVRDKKVLDREGKLDLAKELIQKILNSRKEWGTRAERARRVLTGLKDETWPTYRRGNYCYWRHSSMDQGCIFHSFGSCKVWIELAGEKHIEAKDLSFESAWEQVEEQCGQAFQMPYVGKKSGMGIGDIKI